jgi:hypothetical protein
LARAAEPLTLENGQLYLVFDPRLHGMAKDCELTVHPFRRHPANPVIKPEHPWEGVSQDKGLGRIQLYGSVLWEPDDKLFKIWYLSLTGLPQNQGDQAVCYATSRDGIRWQKPALGLHELYGSKQNNVSSLGDVIPVVYRNPDASDPARRYVKWSLQTRNGDDGVAANYSIHRSFSPDGFCWRREAREPVLPGYPTRYLGGVASDVAMTYWHPRLRRFVCYHKVEPRNPNPAPNDQPRNRLALRSFARFESADGVHWGKPTWAFHRDAEDARHDPYIQFYGVAVHPVGDLYLAFLWLYHSNEGNFDIGLAYSTDTVTWHRPFRGRYVLPRSRPGDWDSGMLFTAAQLVEKDGLWWLYYAGSPYLHRTDKRYFALGLAQTPVGRLVSARCWRKDGSWTVGPLRLAGRQLVVNAAVLDSLRVTVLDEEDRPQPGYRSRIVRGNGTELPVLWEGAHDMSLLPKRPVKLRFELSDAEVFGFTCR